MNVDYVRNWASPEITQTYTEKDTILYGLSMGYGSDPIDADQLAFVYENGLRAVPTMATTLCHPGFWIGDPQTGVNAKMVVHGEHLMHFHAPLPTSGTVRGTTRVTDIVDKGKDRGAIVITEREIVEVNSGRPIATIEQATMCRGDGGFSGTALASGKPAAPQPALGSRTGGDWMRRRRDVRDAARAAAPHDGQKAMSGTTFSQCTHNTGLSVAGSGVP